ncbi:MAG: TniB family NTP-binding protein [Bryobacteraceae bacterium]
MNHLIPAAAAELSRPDEERISRLRRPFWIGYTRAQTILEQLGGLLEHPGTHRMPNLLLAGDTNNGKTMLIRRFVELHPAEQGDLGSKRRVLLIQAPPVPDERRLYFAILDALHAPYSTSGLTAAKMVQVAAMLRKTGVRMLIIDEIHHLMAGHLEKQRQFLNVLKYLSNELQISLVGSGIKDALRAVQTDPQLANRFEPAGLPRWTLDREFRMLLMSFEQALPLRNPSNLAGKELAPALLAMSEGTIGELANVLSAAAAAAIRTGQEQIDEVLLKRIGWIRPSERKASAGRMAG